MPDHSKHNRFAFLILGIIIFGAVFLYKLNINSIGIKEIIIGLIIAYGFSILPDIDSRASKARNQTYIVMWGFILLTAGSLWMINYVPDHVITKTILDHFSEYYIIISQAIVAAVGLVILYLKHRGIMHTYTAAITLSTPFIFIDIIYAPIAFIAYSSHLLLDKVTKHE